MTNTAVPTPPCPDSTARRCPDDLWILGERAVTRARRWLMSLLTNPRHSRPKLLSRIRRGSDGLTFTTRFVDASCAPRIWTWPAKR